MLMVQNVDYDNDDRDDNNDNDNNDAGHNNDHDHFQDNLCFIVKHNFDHKYVFFPNFSFLFFFSFANKILFYKSFYSNFLLISFKLNTFLLYFNFLVFVFSSILKKSTLLKLKSINTKFKILQNKSNELKK